MIKCGVLGAREVCIGLVFKVLNELIPLLFRKRFLLDGCHLGKRKTIDQTAPTGRLPLSSFWSSHIRMLRKGMWCCGRLNSVRGSVRIQNLHTLMNAYVFRSFARSHARLCTVALHTGIPSTKKLTPRTILSLQFYAPQLPAPPPYILGLPKSQFSESPV